MTENRLGIWQKVCLMRPELSTSRERLDPDFFLDFFSVLYTNISFYFFQNCLPNVLLFLESQCTAYISALLYYIFHLCACAHILPWKITEWGGGGGRSWLLGYSNSSQTGLTPRTSVQSSPCVSQVMARPRVGEIYWPIVFSQVDQWRYTEETERKGRPEECLSSCNLRFYPSWKLTKDCLYTKTTFACASYAHYHSANSRKHTFPGSHSHFCFWRRNSTCLLGLTVHCSSLYPAHIRIIRFMKFL